MKHINLFGSHIAFESATLETPYVAYDSEHVHYSSNVGSTAGPEYEMVDLGLPSGLKWANMNIGATSETDYGKYFQWGSTVGYTGDDAKAHSTCKTFVFNDGGDEINHEYVNVHKNEWFNEQLILKPEYDAAHVNMGGKWRMPTYGDLNELISCTTWVYTVINGVTGAKFISKSGNGNSIFIPFAGYCMQNNFEGVGTVGSILGSEPWTGPTFPCILYNTETNCNINTDFGYVAYPIRGVCE